MQSVMQVDITQLESHRTALTGHCQYRPDGNGGHTPWALIVLECSGKGISAWNAFLDTGSLFPLFGLPAALPAPTDDFPLAASSIYSAQHEGGRATMERIRK
jgi:hypothetical protein